MRRVLVLAVLAAALAVPSALALGVPPAVVSTAKAYVVAKYGIGGLKDVHSLRSRKDPRWALVDGFYTTPKRAAGPGIWAVWLQLSGGRWVVRYAGIDRKASQPPIKYLVPCDIQPTFSEPFC